MYKLPLSSKEVRFVDAQLKKGILEACVLAALMREESYGYKIISDISPYIEISESTLYPVLKRLESTNDVTTRSAEHNGRLRRYYMITGRGRIKLREFILQIEEMNRVFDYINREGR